MEPPDSYKATKFPRSIRLQFPKFSKGFSPSDFDEFIKALVGQSNLVSLGRLSYPNEWQMEVTSKDIRENLIRLGRTKVNGRTCWIHPLNASEVRGFVHWLPNEIPCDVITDFLQQYGEVLLIENQKLNKWFGKINSDSRYFSLFLKPGKSSEDVPHFLKIDEHTGLITIKGRSPACFHCKEVGHKKTECKKFKEKLNSYCLRAAGQGVKRTKPRGKRHDPSRKSKDDVSDGMEMPLGVEKEIEKSAGETDLCEGEKPKKKKKKNKKKKKIDQEVASNPSASATVNVNAFEAPDILKNIPTLEDLGKVLQLLAGSGQFSGVCDVMKDLDLNSSNILPADADLDTEFSKVSNIKEDLELTEDCIVLPAHANLDKEYFPQANTDITSVCEVGKDVNLKEELNIPTADAELAMELCIASVEVLENDKGEANANLSEVNKKKRKKKKKKGSNKVA